MTVYVCKENTNEEYGGYEILAICASVESAKAAWIEQYPKATFDDCGCPVSVYEYFKEIGHISSYYVRP